MHLRVAQAIIDVSAQDYIQYIRFVVITGLTLFQTSMQEHRLKHGGDSFHFGNNTGLVQQK
jgi:hypothetical protein